MSLFPRATRISLAALAVAASAAAVTGCGSHTYQPAATSTVASRPAVSPAKTTHAKVTAPRTVAPAAATTSPVPAATTAPVVAPVPSAASVMPCAAADLTAALAGQDGGAGHARIDIVVTNAAGQPCTLSGYPTLSLRDAHGQPVPLRTGHGADMAFPAVTPRTITLAPHERASFSLGFSDIPTGTETDCPTGQQLLVAVPGAAATEKTTVEVMMAPCGGGAVTVSPFVSGVAGVA